MARARLLFAAIAPVLGGCFLVAPFDAPPPSDAPPSSDAPADADDDLGAEDEEQSPFTDLPEVPDAPDDSEEDIQRCTPDCGGRACGDDGCGGVCAWTCGAGDGCSMDGQCLAGCAETFRFTFPSSTARQAVLAPGGALYVAGATDGTGWVASFDPCTGERSALASLELEGAVSTSLHSLTVTGNDVYASGSVVTDSDPGEGLFARLAADTLEVDGAYPLAGSAGVDETIGIAVAGGDLWMAGSANLDATPGIWEVRGTSSGDACGFSRGNEGSGHGRTVATRDHDVWVAGDIDARTHLFRYDSAVCSMEECGCTPELDSGDLAIGSAETMVLHLAFVADRLFAAGVAKDSNAENQAQFFAFVAELDTATGSPISVYSRDPTPYFDAFGAIGTDGQRLYVAGTQGWDGTPEGYEATEGVVMAIPLSLAAPDWTVRPDGTTVLWGAAADEHAVYVSGDAGSDAVVFSCTPQGVCN